MIRFMLHSAHALRPALRPALLMTAACLIVSGCKRPDPAPIELDELVGFMFEHFHDEDPASLEESAINLEPWLVDRIDETLEGYTINNLSDETVLSLGKGDMSVDLLAGATVGHQSLFSVMELTEAILYEDALDVYGNTYSAFSREWSSNKECFKTAGCESAEAEVNAVSSYAGAITVDTNSGNEFRWIETEQGRMMLFRTWLFQPATITPEILVVDRQFFLNVVMDTEDGVRTMQATWVIAQLLGASLDTDGALQLVINGMTKNADAVDEWLTENN